MSEPTQEQVISIVSSMFEVQAVNITLEKMEFDIADAEFREKFVTLAQKLELIGIICFLQRSDDKVTIQVNRLPPESKKKKLLSRAWIQRILFGVVVAFVMVDGYYR
ncbi:MAG: site-2 protease family protein, partial [Nitrososphaerota archaeon]|nr:site-2 protease family protein [Nitrososphaerota archaeon]